MRIDLDGLWPGPRPSGYAGLARGEKSNVRVLPAERLLSNGSDAASTREKQDETPVGIGRSEIVSFALVGLLIISIAAILYVAKPFFLPVVMAFVVGTMLSPAASFLESYHIPSWVGAVLIVSTGGAEGAFVVGTMLSPPASFLERYHIPRSVGAVLIVSTVGAAVAFIIGLISSPLMEWSSRLPELVLRFKDKLHVFDRPLALWHELQGML